MGFTGDANEPGGVLASKVTAAISMYGDELKKGESATVPGNLPKNTPSGEASKRAKKAGFNLSYTGGAWKITKR